MSGLGDVENKKQHRKDEKRKKEGKVEWKRV